MTYRISGLAPEDFAGLFALDDAALAGRRARRVVANADHGYPCRVSLEDARKGETLLLIHHVHHAVETPYRSAFAIYVRENVRETARYVDGCPPVFAGRPIALRGYDESGDLYAARLVPDGNADATICEMLTDPAIDHIDAHNAAHGCFSARIERHGEAA